MIDIICCYWSSNHSWICPFKLAHSNINDAWNWHQGWLKEHVWTWWCKLQMESIMSKVYNLSFHLTLNLLSTWDSIIHFIKFSILTWLHESVTTDWAVKQSPGLVPQTVVHTCVIFTVIFTIIFASFTLWVYWIVVLVLHLMNIGCLERTFWYDKVTRSFNYCILLHNMDWCLDRP